eukprot:4842573-Prymnesium_polylepis.1
MIYGRPRGATPAWLWNVHPGGRWVAHVLVCCHVLVELLLLEQRADACSLRAACGREAHALRRAVARRRVVLAIRDERVELRRSQRCALARLATRCAAAPPAPPPLAPG